MEPPPKTPAPGKGHITWRGQKPQAMEASSSPYPHQTPRCRRPTRLDKDHTTAPTLFSTPARRIRAPAQYSAPDAASDEDVADEIIEELEDVSPTPIGLFATPARRPPRQRQIVTDEASEESEEYYLDHEDKLLYPQDSAQDIDDQYHSDCDNGNQLGHSDTADDIKVQRLEIRLAWTKIAAAKSRIEIETLQLKNERADLKRERAELGQERMRIDQILSGLEARVKAMKNAAAVNGV